MGVPQGKLMVDSQGGTSTEFNIEALFMAHHQRIFLAAYRITGNTTDAEDVSQSVFLNVIKRFDRDGKLDLGDNAAGYLAKSAINASLDMLRSKSRRQTVDVDGVQNKSAISTDTEQLSDKLAKQELQTALRDALMRIDPTAAEMVALRYFEGYGNAEIAQIMSTSTSTVGVTLHRARHRLKQELKAYAQAVSIEGGKE